MHRTAFWTGLKIFLRHFDGPAHFSATGWLNPLPPQQGIPGWQRFGMAVYDPGNGGSESGEPLIVYEGIVLPGENIILGRWVGRWGIHQGGDPMDGDPSGPFIAWNCKPA